MEIPNPDGGADLELPAVSPLGTRKMKATLLTTHCGKCSLKSFYTT